MAKHKAKRYTEEEKEEILKFIDDFGRGGMTTAVKKYKVTPATIYSWRKKAGSPGGSIKTSTSGKPSKELQNVQALAQILTEMQVAEDKLATLRRQYMTAKAKL